MLFSINEGTVNVVDVAAKVRNAFWDASLILINSNAPRIEDSDGTRGNLVKLTALFFLLPQH